MNVQMEFKLVKEVEKLKIDFNKSAEMKFSTQSDVEKLKIDFNKTTEKVIRDIKRKDRIMHRSDKRQVSEYDDLQISHQKIINLNKEIEETQSEVVFTLGAVAESRSKETGNHVKRVAEYSKLLALKYGLDDEKAELLKQASPMHDIGKIAIPDSILNKPGRLDNEERKIMNTHAQQGYDMLKHSERKLLKCAAIVAYEHHEKWDGTGYPNRLKGEEIHIYGRITALADVFDALGSERCYKKAWSDEKILQLFNKETGKHFDPYLINIFLDNIEEFYTIRKRFKDNF